MFNRDPKIPINQKAKIDGENLDSYDIQNVKGMSLKSFEVCAEKVVRYLQKVIIN